MTVKKTFSLIPEKRLLALYQSMLQCRALAHKADAGSEALLCSVALQLSPRDALAAEGGAMALRRLKGEPLNRLMRGAAADVQRGFHPLPALKCNAAEQLYFAAGVAMAQKRQRAGLATVVFLDGKKCHGRQWEAALRFIAAQGLGLIVVCDGAAKSRKRGSPWMDEPGSRSNVKGLPPVLHVDRGDAIAVYRVTQEAMTHAREHQRTTLLRAFGPHEIGPADPHAKLDPILRMEAYLRSKGIPGKGLKTKVRQKHNRGKR